MTGRMEEYHRLLRKVLRQGEIEVVRLFLRDGALVSTGLDLVEQHIARPAEAGGGAEIPKAGCGDFDLLEEFDVVSPGDRGKQFWNKLCQKLIMAEDNGFSGHFCNSLSQK